MFNLKNHRIMMAIAWGVVFLAAFTLVVSMLP